MWNEADVLTVGRSLVEQCRDEQAHYFICCRLYRGKLRKLGDVHLTKESADSNVIRLRSITLSYFFYHRPELGLPSCILTGSNNVNCFVLG